MERLWRLHRRPKRPCISDEVVHKEEYKSDPFGGQQGRPTKRMRDEKVPFTEPMTSHQLPSSEDPGIPLSLPIESPSTPSSVKDLPFPTPFEIRDAFDP